MEVNRVPEPPSSTIPGDRRQTDVTAEVGPMSGGRWSAKLRRAMGWVADDDHLAREAGREQAEVDLRAVTEPRAGHDGESEGGHDDA
jgi:hypothetical protein